MVEAYPLSYPVGWKRTLNPERARFGEHSFVKSTNYLYSELQKMGANNIIISSNLELSTKGFPYSNQKRPQDNGVAVYFKFKGKEQCMPCDRWDRVEHNLWAVYKSVEALRGLERWGAKEMVDAAFRGFVALPDYSGTHYFSEEKGEELKEKYRRLAKELHPDNGGNEQEFITMKQEYEQLTKGRSD